jgi:hypothetical protein
MGDHIVGFYIKLWCQLEMQKLPHHTCNFASAHADIANFILIMVKCLFNYFSYYPNQAKMMSTNK